jgi:osmotically-inducible protein OsmY
MKNLRLGVLLAGVAIVAVAAGCSETANNSNANANRANVNTNANMAPANANANANANSNTNRGLTRDEFEKDMDKYAKQAKGLGRKIGAGANDAWIWAKTRSVLTTADDLSDSTINVDVENGVITLSGTVSSQEQVKKADELAKGIEGQKGVQNKLQVAPGGANGNANKSKSGKRP